MASLGMFCPSSPTARSGRSASAAAPRGAPAPAQAKFLACGLRSESAAHSLLGRPGSEVARVVAARRRAALAAAQETSQFREKGQGAKCRL
jgi:hypothetical protein